MQKEISERLEDFAVAILQLIEKINKTYAGRHIAGQLVRSSTSAGANYEEACGAESRADFVHKLQVVLKELRESLYWLRLTSKAKIIPPSVLEPILNEAKELTNIIAKSVVTAKKKKG
jgi:four helix bundle protein